MNKMSYATTLSAGLDLLSMEDVTIKAYSHVTINVGKIDLHQMDYLGNVVGFVMPKSGLSVKHNIVARLGVIDQDYTGDVMVVLDNRSYTNYKVKRGDKVAQLVVTPFIHLNYPIIEKERGENGFGSTGI